MEIEARSLINRSKIPSVDYVVNPYVGCVFGCAYCYASASGRRVGESVSAWGDYLYVKTNAVEVVRKQLQRMGEDKRRGTLVLSSQTDPYQGHEKHYRLTRGILAELVEVRYPGTVRILTKSPLVTRDIDLLTALPDAEVGLTVTSTDDSVSRWLEVRAPLASRRLKTLAELHEAGVRTYAFVGPLLPHKNYVRALAFSPDGTRLLTGGDDAVARLWDVRSGRLLGETPRQKGPINAVAVACDGRKFLTGSWDKAARLWTAAE